MKQVLQDLSNGDTFLESVPVPQATSGHVLIQTTCSLVSAGTERMLVEFGKSNWLQKARQQPDKVRMVVDKVKTDGLLPTIDAVRSKLNQPLPMGYSNVGVVVELGPGVTGFEIGDRVVSNGYHAEFVSVPKHLCARIPAAVSDEQAAFTVLGAIALQGIRLVQPTLGETVVVTGLGLIGLLTVQLLKANGCHVIGIDIDPAKLQLAQELGAQTVQANQESVVSRVQQLTAGRGADAVLLTLSSDSDEPLHQAAQMCRKRGRIVLIGVTGLQLSRADFFEKELTFQVSCSYGPGRYDPAYEQKGQDYPLGYVRWTEQRNFDAFLGLAAANALSLDRLITHRFDIDCADQAYALLTGGEPALGIVLTYAQGSLVPTLPDNNSAHALHRTIRLPGTTVTTASPVVCGFIGSGNYAARVLMPAFAKTACAMDAVSCRAGVSGVQIAKSLRIPKVTTDNREILEDSAINTVVIATRHDTHALLVSQALAHDKHVFVEKPLALNHDQLSLVESACHGFQARNQHLPRVMVGFNRRFSPHVQRLLPVLRKSTAPKSFVITVNAGTLPLDHWTQDPAVGGGRLVGEGCHFIDLMRFLAGTSVTDIDVQTATQPRQKGLLADIFTVIMKFECGSLGTLHYFSNGSSRFPKERVEVFCEGQVAQIDNFRSTEGFGWEGLKRFRTFRQDKGQHACVQAFVQAIANGTENPIPLDEVLEVSRVTLAAAECLH
jgi:predicted dehydrogenase/threonine dehydrogenase-like Zn-dependent dehydrogenase